MEKVSNSRREVVSVRDARRILVVVDVQNDYCHEGGAFGRAGFSVRAIQEAVARLERFLKAWRVGGLPVLFVRTEHSPWTDAAGWRERLRGLGREVVPEICRAGSWGAEFYRIGPGRGELVVTKHRFSAFCGTDLDLVLRSQEITSLVIAGVTTDVCVESTVRSAVDLGYVVTVVGDCCGALDVKEHELALERIGKYFGRVEMSKSLLRVLPAPEDLGKGT
ncbi:MAG: isochorismatase family cysteine hydrolase [Armatimonadota bacterium]|nr:isochorismatase family cysteine hydrolase [Armatimonadota bacterium]